MALSTISSSSSSSVTSPWLYDVFLSFRGEDTRDTFTAYLYHALNRKGIRIFIDDDEVKRGDEISTKLLPAIEDSRISIIVLSKNYASSTWCLDELVKILECKKSKQQIVLPVFYHVDPSDIRHQRGSFGEALAKHAEKLNGDMKLQMWKAALREVANLSGDHLIRNGEVVRQESPKNLGARSRLFFPEDVRDVLEEDTGTDNVQAIVVDFPEDDDMIRLSSKAFKKMNRLRLFRCRNARFSGELKSLPNGIRVLDWPKCPLQSMPSKFRGDKLSILRMPGSHIQEIRLEFKAEMIFPGEKIPDWFSHCKEIPSNSHRCEFDIKVAPLYNLDDIIGIAFCAVIEPVAPLELAVYIKGGYTFPDRYIEAYAEFDENDLDHVWLRYLTIDDITRLRAVPMRVDDLGIIVESTPNLNLVDNLRIIFEISDPDLVIFKHCGVHLLYKQHDKQNVKDHENVDVHLDAPIEDIGNLANTMDHGSQLSKRRLVDSDDDDQDDHNIESNLGILVFMRTVEVSSRYD